MFAACSACSDRGPVNIVLISIDTLRADHVGVYGYHRDTTPNIDRFAREAVIFADPVAPAPQTLASHASLFTSLLPSHHGALGNFRFKLADDAVTMAEILADNGYATVSFNDGGLLDEDFGCGQGFELYDSTRKKSPFAGRVAPAKEWLAQEPAEPFFLFLHTYEVHLPLTPEPQYLELFESDYDGPLPGHFGGTVLRRFRDGEIETDRANVDHIVALYDAAIRSMDDSFQDLIDSLRGRGLYDRSLIILTSDHGEEYGERGRIAVHGPTLYDEVIRVPLIIKFPHDRFASTVVEQQVRLIDILPTMLELIEVEPLPHFEGTSLVGLIDGSQEGDLPAVSETRTGKLASLRDRSWKLIKGNRKGMLFDVEHDPAEFNDVAQDNPGQVESLVATLDAIRSARPERSTPHDPDAESIEQLRALGYVE
jgi:arylsulfatase A-like enzyme